MNVKRFLIPILLLTLVSAAAGQTMNAKVRATVDKSYKLWRFAANKTPLGTPVNDRVLTADLNNDGKKDYVLKIVSGGKGHIIAAIAQGNDYKTYPVRTEDEGVDNILVSIHKKGSYFYETEGDETPKLKLPSDAIFTCWDGTDDCGTFIFKAGKFQVL